MRRFLNNLFRDFRTTGTARGGRRAPRRATLQVEGLEDRLALTSASQIGAVLTINASPGDRGGLGVFSVNPVQFRTITLESDGHGQIDVNDSVQGLVNHFTISSIKNVVVVVQGLDVVTINDSLGMPFATGTTVTVGGNGQYVNTMNLVGSLPINGDEQCVAPLPSASTSAASFIKVDGVTFDYTSAIQSVADGLLITGTFDVETSSPEVFLYGSDHHDQELLNLRGRYETLNFANKNQVVLNEYAANAGIILEATTPDAPNELFSADMHGAGDVTTIFSTPYKVITDVETTVAPVANQAAVQVDANNGPVTVEGNSSTKMTIGYEPAPLRRSLHQGHPGVHHRPRPAIPDRVGQRQLFDAGEREGDRPVHLRHRPVREQQRDRQLLQRGGALPRHRPRVGHVHGGWLPAGRAVQQHHPNLRLLRGPVPRRCLRGLRQPPQPLAEQGPAGERG